MLACWAAQDLSASGDRNSTNKPVQHVRRTMLRGPAVDAVGGKKGKSTRILSTRFTRFAEGREDNIRTTKASAGIKYTVSEGPLVHQLSNQLMRLRVLCPLCAAPPPSERQVQYTVT